MKLFSKTIAAILSAFVILSCAVPTVGAAQAAPCPQVRVIRCDGSDCPNINELLEKLCSERGFCLNDILRSIGCYCPDGDCGENTPDAPAQQPTENDIQPAEKPTEPVVIPSQPEKPTEPAVVPTEPVAAPTEPTAPPQQEESEFNSAYEAQVLRLVNAERAKTGLAPLVMDDGAVKVAHLRAKEIVQSFSHSRPDGRSCFTAASDLGISYRFAGENIAYGYKTPEQVVNGWMNSEGHRKNILSASFTKIGIGCYESSGVLYWSQFFIG